MNAEKPGGRVLSGAGRISRAMWNYIRSDETRAKVEQARRKAVEVGRVASDGAKEAGAKAVRAAAHAKDRVDELSKSEKAKVLREKAGDGWEEIKGGKYRGTRLSESRIVVALSLMLCYPLGLYLLWRHPTLGRSRVWWSIGCVWGSFVTLAVIGGNGDRDAEALHVSLLGAKTVEYDDEIGQAHTLLISKDSERIITGHDKGMVRVWGFNSKAKPFTIAMGGGSRRLVQDPWGETHSIEDNPAVGTVTITDDGKTIAAWHQGTDRPRAWSLKSLVEGEVTGNFLPATDGTLAVGGARFAMSRGSSISVYRIGSDRPYGELSGHEGTIRFIATSPDAHTLASAGSDASVRLWDMEAMEQRAVLVGHSSLINQLAFSGDGHLLASISEDSDARIWDVEKGTLVRTIPHHSYIRLVAISPDGKLLATQTGSESLAKGEEAWHVFIHDVGTRALRARLIGPDTMLSNLRFSPDGRYLVATGWEPKLFLWDVEEIPPGSACNLDSSKTERIDAVDFSRGPRGEPIENEERTYVGWGAGRYTRLFYRDPSGIKRTHGMIKYYIEERLVREEIYVGGNFKAENSWDRLGRPLVAEQYEGDGHHTRQEWEYLPSGELLIQRRFAVVHQPTPTGERRLFVKEGSFPIYRPDGSLLEIHEFEDGRRVRVRMFDEYGNMTGDSGAL